MINLTQGRRLQARDLQHTLKSFNTLKTGGAAERRRQRQRRRRAVGARAGWTHGAAVTRFISPWPARAVLPAGKKHRHPPAGIPQPPSRPHPAGDAPHGPAPTEDSGSGGPRAVPALQSHPSGVWQRSPGEVCFPFPVLQVTLETRRLETINVLIA